MAGEIASENGGRSSEQSVAEYDAPTIAPGGSPSHLVERFGMGVAAGILVGSVVGVAAAWALGADGAVALLIALGVGFILSPVVGVLVAERGE